MDSEAEMIEGRMKETREDLTKKLETLEKQVVETVQNTTSAVSETVESVKEVVEGTVESVQTAVEETTEAVKKTFDLRLQVENHPWLMLGGSVAVGFVAGRLLEGLLPAPSSRYYNEALPPPSAGGAGYRGERADWYASETPSQREAAPAESHARSGGGWFDALTRQFAPEVDKLKGMAIGTVVGLIRDMVKQSLPEELGGRLSEVLDDATQKMGGEPFRGPVMPEESGQEGPRHGYSRGQTQPSGSSSGRGQSGVPPFNRL